MIKEVKIRSMVEVNITSIFKIEKHLIIEENTVKN